MPRRIPVTRDDLSADVAEMIHAIGHRVRIELRRDLADTGVTWAQMRALRIVAGALRAHSSPSDRHDSAADMVTMSGLADALRIARRSATSLVDELEQRSLVRRVAVEQDRRATALEITDAGLAMLRTLDERRRVAAATVLAPLTAAELAVVRTTLAKAVR